MNRILLFVYLSLSTLASIQAAPTKWPKEQESYSQASQDKFVYTLLYGLVGKEETGYYLEIGASHPININNTYFLEKNMGWKGVSLDITSHHVKSWNEKRSNSLLIQDAREADYLSILESFPSVIDYLSLDIDKDYDVVLNKIPFDKYLFKVITIEHDYYKFKDKYRSLEREILSSLGYYLLCPDLSNRGVIFEDWWIHPDAFPPSVLEKLFSLELEGKNHDYVIEVLENL